MLYRGARSLRMACNLGCIVGMPCARIFIILCTVLGALIGSSYSAKSCSTLLSSSRGFQYCKSLTELSSTLAWTVHDSTNAVDFAFSGSAPSSDGWVGWGINPTGTSMVGTQALIAFQGSQNPVVHAYNITSAVLQGTALTPGAVTLNYSGTSTEISGTEMTIYTTLYLKTNDSLSMNHVWNQGSSVDLTTNAPKEHSLSGDNLNSVLTITLTTGATSSVGQPHQKLKNRHGIISAVSWGLLLPLGIMTARYLRPLLGSNPLWFFIHVGCQCSGYILGVVSWAMGMKLETYSGAVYYKHRNIGISIFALATLQVLALILRPNKQNKFRKYWNVYHHVVGYATLILIIINIFEGLHILQPGDKWTNAYIAVVTVLGGISLVLEVIIWSMWLRQRSKGLGSQLKGTGSRSVNGQEKPAESV